MANYRAIAWLLGFQEASAFTRMRTSAGQANRRRNAAAWVCVTDRLHPLPDERAGPQRRFPCSMQLHARVRPAGERAGDDIQGDLRRPVQGLLVHLVERLVHQPREGALDQEALAAQEAHQAADRAIGAERNERAEIAVAER